MSFILPPLWELYYILIDAHNKKGLCRVNFMAIYALKSVTWWLVSFNASLLAEHVNSVLNGAGVVFSLLCHSSGVMVLIFCLIVKSGNIRAKLKSRRQSRLFLTTRCSIQMLMLPLSIQQPQGRPGLVVRFFDTNVIIIYHLIIGLTWQFEAHFGVLEQIFIRHGYIICIGKKQMTPWPKMYLVSGPHRFVIAAKLIITHFWFQVFVLKVSAL